MRIRDVQLTMIWGDTTFRFLTPGARQPPMAFLGKAGEYARMFGAAIQDLGGRPEGQRGTFLPPWQELNRQRFWFHYLEKRAAAGELALKKLVPFRVRLPLNIRANWLSGRLDFEAFFHSFGISLVANARWRGELMPVDQVVQEAQSVAVGGRLSCEWLGSGTTALAAVNWPHAQGASLTMNALAASVLDCLARMALGDAAEERRAWGATPFTIFSIIRGEELPAAPAGPTAGDAIHLAMEAVTGWTGTYPNVDVDDFDRRVIPAGRGGGPGAVLYGRGRRARAVWSPAKAAIVEGAAPRHSLGCYHRNLVFATLQTEALCRFGDELVMEKERGSSWDTATREIARHAAVVLTLLCCGNRNATYRCGSVRTQIEDGRWVETINRLRLECMVGPPVEL